MADKVINSNLAYAIIDKSTHYPTDFNPSIRYPEYQFSKLSFENKVYDQVRVLLHDMQLDSIHFGLPTWNPLGDIIQPGQTVVIKPNLVRHYNPTEPHINAVVTHGSIIRALVDYCYIALQGNGSLIIADAPIQSTDFDSVAKFTRLHEIVDIYKKEKNFSIEILDLRKKICLHDVTTTKVEKEGDHRGYSTVDLGLHSCHNGRKVAWNKYRVTDYDPNLMITCHNENAHKYLISNSILLADVIINLPKLKTHRKAGITGALKNLIGINCLKDYLPHHTKGSLQNGGDEYQYKHILTKLQSDLLDIKNSLSSTKNIRINLIDYAMRINRVLMKITKSKDEYFEGSWYGNDTIWRTILDLNRILMYADKKGTMQLDPQRKMMIIVDAIVTGEKEGPLEPTSKHCGGLIGGFNPATVDYLNAALMGYNPALFPHITNAFRLDRSKLVSFSPGEIGFVINGKDVPYEHLINYTFDMIPSKGWIKRLVAR